MGYADTHSATRSQTFANAGELANATAFKTSIATSTSAAEYTGGALNGALGASALPFGRKVTVTTTTSAAAYRVGASFPIVVTGEDEFGQALTESLLLVATNGNETITGTKGFAKVTSIAIPAQLTTAGFFTFGATGVKVNHPRVPIRAIRGGGAGNVAVKYAGGWADTIPFAAAERQDLLVEEVVATGTTAFPVTVFS